MSIVGACAAAAVVAGSGSASALPLDTLVNSTCSFNQIVAATYAVSPEEAVALANSPIAPQFASFLASPPFQRQLLFTTQPWIADSISSFLNGPGAGLAGNAFATCNQF
jgi:hemophore-related protein